MKNFIIILITTLLASCGGDIDNRTSLNNSQKAEISQRIKAFGVVNLPSEPSKSFTGPYVVNGQAMQVAAVESLPGEAKYGACAACHGANGGGGMGPALAGKTTEYISGRLTSYKNGETVGSQSNLMWAQAGMLNKTDISDLAEYISTL